ILSATLSPSGAYRATPPLLRSGDPSRLWGGVGSVGGGQALAHHLLDVATTQLGHLRRGLQLLQGGQRRADRVDRVVRAVRLGEDVFDSGRLDDGSHGPARDDAG